MAYNLGMNGKLLVWGIGRSQQGKYILCSAFEGRGVLKKDIGKPYRLNLLRMIIHVFSTSSTTKLV